MRGVKEEHSHPEDCLNDDRLLMDGCVVHEKYHGSPVITTVTPYLEEQLVDEVFKDRGIDTSFDQKPLHHVLQIVSLFL